MRHMTRDELVDALTARLPDTQFDRVAAAAYVVDNLAEMGVQVDALAKWTPRAPEPDPESDSD